MGGKPKTSTPADRRLKANKSGSSAKPKFGSPAWDKKYGAKQFGKKSK